MRWPPYFFISLSSYSSAISATSRSVAVGSSGSSVVPPRMVCVNRIGVLGRVHRERAEPQVAVELEQLLGERPVDVDALHELRGAADHRAVVAPGHDVDHHVGGALLDDVERVVDLAVGGAVLDGALDEERSRDLGGIHTRVVTTCATPC